LRGGRRGPPLFLFEEEMGMLTLLRDEPMQA